MLGWDLRVHLQNLLLKTLEIGAYEKDAHRESNLTPQCWFLRIISNTIIMKILKIIIKLIMYVVYAVVVICMISLWNCVWFTPFWFKPASSRSRYSDSVRAGRSGDRIIVGDQVFHNRLDPLWGSPSLLYDGHRVSFPGGEAWLNHPSPSSPKLKKA